MSGGSQGWSCAVAGIWWALTLHTRTSWCQAIHWLWPAVRTRVGGRRSRFGTHIGSEHVWNPNLRGYFIHVQKCAKSHYIMHILWPFWTSSNWWHPVSPSYAPEEMPWGCLVAIYIFSGQAIINNLNWSVYITYSADILAEDNQK